jgi:hypothetical protein
MKRVNMVLCGMAILSLVFAFGLPVAHSQALDGLEAQVQASLKWVTFVDQQNLGDKGKAPALLFENGGTSECDGAGFSYDLVIIENYDAEGEDCNLVQIGVLDTCEGEESAVADVEVDNTPIDTTNYAFIWATGPVKKFSDFSSKAGESDLFDETDTWIGIAKKAQLKLKEKALDKQKIMCNLP